VRGDRDNAGVRRLCLAEGRSRHNLDPCRTKHSLGAAQDDRRVGAGEVGANRPPTDEPDPADGAESMRSTTTRPSDGCVGVENTRATAP